MSESTRYIFTESIGLGTDPEFFLMKGEELVSGEKYTEGTKNRPVNISLTQSVVGLQRDNVAVEYSCEPGYNCEQFVSNIRNAMRSLRKVIPADVSIVCLPSAVFPDKELKSELAREYGCEPDYNAYTGAINDAPPDAMNSNLRSCGGHVHVSTNNNGYCLALKDPIGHPYVVQMMDIFLGIPFTVWDNSPEAIQRRELYGKPGCYRPTPYGVEYRSLSNFWLKHPKLVTYVYYLTCSAISACIGLRLDELQKALGGVDAITGIIEEGDSEAARKLLPKVRESMTYMGYAMLPQIENLVKTLNPLDDISKYWGGATT